MNQGVILVSLTADCTTDERSNRTHRVNVDSATQAGIHVPVSVLFSICKVELVDGVEFLRWVSRYSSRSDAGSDISP